MLFSVHDELIVHICVRPLFGRMEWRRKKHSGTEIITQAIIIAKTNVLEGMFSHWCKFSQKCSLERAC